MGVPTMHAGSPARCRVGGHQGISACTWQRTTASAWETARLGLPGQWGSSVPGGVQEGLQMVLAE